MVYNSLTAPSNIENLIESKFNIETNMEDFKIKILKSEIVFSEIELFKSNKKIFSSEEVSLKIDIKRSLKKSLLSKKLMIWFKEASFSKISINSKIDKDFDNSCEYIMNISYSKSL